MKLKDVYTDADYEIQLKAPVLQSVLYILIFAVILTITSSIITGISLGAIVLSVWLVILVLCFIGNKKGIYKKSSVGVIYSMTIILITARFANGYDGEHSLANTALTALLFIFMSSLFSPKRRHLYIITAISTAYFISFVTFVKISGSYTENSASFLKQMTSGIAIFIVSTFLSIVLRTILDLVIVEARTKIEETEEYSKKMTALASEASQKLKLAQIMDNQAQETVIAVKGIENSANDVTDQMDSLKGQYNSSKDSLRQIEINMKSLDQIAEEQSNKISETSASLEEIAASIKSVLNIIEVKSDSVKELKTTAKSGTVVMNKTSTSFNEVKIHIEKIKEMVSIISNIASKTNLLAMNAAIEAAHAGDAGKGFAVVSDEVRKLAETSSENSKKVGETLNQLVIAIEQTGKNVVNSGESFSSIGDGIDQVDLAMEEIRYSIVELSSGSDQILNSTTILNNLTQKVVDSVKDAKMNEANTVENIDYLGEFIQSLGKSMSGITDGSSTIHQATLGLSEKCNVINNYVKEFSKKLN